jgi:hypothetical protein
LVKSAQGNVIVLAERQDSTTSFSIGMTFVLYILAMASKLTEKLKFLKYLLALVLSSLCFYSKKDFYL